MKTITILMIFTLGLFKTNAQTVDSLARCGRAPYSLIINYPKNITDNFNVNYTFEQGGSKSTYKYTRSANYNSKYCKLELNEYLNLDNQAKNYYKIQLDATTVYVDDVLLQKFVDDYLSAKKSKIHKEIWLNKYFSSVSYQKYINNIKKNLPKYENDYCFNSLNVAEINSIATSLALRNYLLELKNEGIVKKVSGNQFTVKTIDKSDFTADLDYYVVGKPSLRVRFKTNKNNDTFEGIYENIENTNIGIEVNDVITNIFQQ